MTENLSETDLLELISLDAKACNEGSLNYTVENWNWRFEDPRLNEAANVAEWTSVLRKAIHAHSAEIDAWWDAHPGQPGADLINAHRERQDALREAEAGE